MIDSKPKNRTQSDGAIKVGHGEKRIFVSTDFDNINDSNEEPLISEKDRIDNFILKRERVETDQYTEAIEILDPSINNIQDKTVKHKKTYQRLLFKKILLFMFHLLLISLFEIIFFMTFITSSEDKALYSLIDQFTNTVVNGCDTLSPDDKKIASYVVDLFVNETSIFSRGDAQEAIRNSYNSKLVINSWLYFVGLLVINIVLLAINYRCKINVKLKVVLFDNLAMVMLLGLYEYLFFSTIIMQYESVSYPELTEYIFKKLNTCGIT
jgi:hypothetical protein